MARCERVAADENLCGGLERFACRFDPFRLMRSAKRGGVGGYPALY